MINIVYVPVELSLVELLVVVELLVPPDHPINLTKNGNIDLLIHEKINLVLNKC